MPFIAIALLLAAAIGGGTSVAAQNALPGDALWGFKVGVNESVGAALAPSGKAQADFDIAAMESRMKEATTLAANGKLSADAKADVETNFEAHAKSVQAEIAKLEDSGDYSGAADVAARFQAAVATHASALADANGSATAEVKANLGDLIAKVRGTLDAASTLSAKASADAAANAEATAHSDTQAAGQDTTQGSNASSGVQVHTGTSVQGGTGGIKVDSQTGSTIGI